MSAGNRYADTNTQLEQDFTRFANDGIKKISIRLMWSVLEPNYNPSTCTLETSIINNYKRVLTIAQQHDIDVNIDFWTHFQDVHWDMPTYVNSIYDIIRDPETKQRWLRYVQAVVTELGDYPAVESWAILNEPFYDQSGDKQLFQQLFAEQTAVIRAADPDALVICRFPLSYTPGSGRFDDSVYDIFDAFAVTIYIDPSNPSDTKGNGRWSYWENTVADCQARGIPLWVIEFGDDNTSQEHNRLHYEQSLAKFQADGVVRAYAWAWQTRSATSEPYNIYDGTNPMPAYYELSNYGS